MLLTTLLSSILFLLAPAQIFARTNTSSQYIALDVYYGTPLAPCINSADGWAPSLAALKNPTNCYGIGGGHNITCISRRMYRLDADEKMISLAPMDCQVQGFTTDECGGPTRWPAQFNSANQTWTWVWDQSVGMVDIESFRMYCP